MAPKRQNRSAHLPYSVSRSTDSSTLPVGRHSSSSNALEALESKLARFESMTQDMETSERSLSSEIQVCREKQHTQLYRTVRSMQGGHQFQQYYRSLKSLEALTTKPSRLPRALGDICDDRVCRICFGQGGRLISPCRCSGTQRWVHTICLTRWRDHSSGVRESNSCEICRSFYRMRPPPFVVGQVLVPDADVGSASLGVPALLIHLDREVAELVELGIDLGPVSTDAYSVSLEVQVTRLLGGPSGEPWAAAALGSLPLCRLPASLEVNGPIHGALQKSSDSAPGSCLLTGSAASVLGVCNAQSQPLDGSDVLFFEGRHRWPRVRLDQLVQNGTLGVASVALAELLGSDGRRRLLDELHSRAVFASTMQ